MSTLQVNTRDQKGSRASKKLRQNGLIPGVIYGRKQNVISVDLTLEDFAPYARQGAIVQLKVGDKEENAIVKEIQLSVYGDQILHVDFQRISMDEKIQVSVPLEFVGIPKGLNTGGTRDIQLRELEISCFPNQIPKKITINIENLDMGEQLRVKDLDVPSEMDVHTDSDLIVAIIHGPRVEEESTTEEEARTEPERISKEKEEK